MANKQMVLPSSAHPLLCPFNRTDAMSTQKEKKNKQQNNINIQNLFKIIC